MEYFLFLFNFIVTYWKMMIKKQLNFDELDFSLRRKNYSYKIIGLINILNIPSFVKFSSLLFPYPIFLFTI